MASKRQVKVNPSAMLISAARRFDLPALPVRLKYDPETDTLYLWFREDLEANRTTDDLEAGLVFDYHNRTLVGVEVLNASVMMAS
jgi:uncharacterized protein YuzE